MPGTGTTVFIAAVFALAGLVKGTIGLGLPTVAVGLLGLVMPPAQAAALLIVPSMATNVLQLAAGPNILPLLRRLWPILAGIGLGTALGAAALPSGQGAQGWQAAAMGGALVAYALSGLFKADLRVPARLEPLLSPLAGVVNGVVTSVTGTFVLPSVPYLQALGLSRDDLVQALGLSFTASTIALAAALVHAGAFHVDALGASVLALLPALLGMVAGGWLRTRIQPSTFRRWFYLGLLVLGLELVRAAWV